MFASATLLLTVALGVEPQIIRAELTLKAAGARQWLGSPMPQRLSLRSERPEAIRNAPAGTLWWGALRFGASPQPREIHVAVDEGDPSAARLLVDANANADLSDDSPTEWKLVDADNPDSSRYEGSFDLPLQVEGGSEKVRVFAYRYLPEPSKRRGLPDDLLFYYRDYCRTGTAEVDGRRCAVMVSDEDTTGDFSHPDGRGSRLRYAIDLNGDGGIGGAEWFEAGQSVKLGGVQLVLKSLSADGRLMQLLAVPEGVKLAQPFSGPGLDGATVRFPEDFRGKLVLLEFWATWCGACRSEIPNFVAAAERFSGEKLAVLGISLDRENAAATVRTFTQQQRMNWRQVYEGKGWESEISRRYGVRSIPSVFLVEADTLKIVADGAELRGAQLPATLARHVGAAAPGPGGDKGALIPK